MRKVFAGITLVLSLIAPIFSDAAEKRSVSSDEEKAIVAVLKKTLGMEDIEFKIAYLGIKKGWAWIETYPERRSAGRTDILEPVSALLRKERGEWRVLEFKPCCGEYEDDPEIQKAGGFVNLLKKRYPSIPHEIFSKE